MNRSNRVALFLPASVLAVTLTAVCTAPLCAQEQEAQQSSVPATSFLSTSDSPAEYSSSAAPAESSAVQNLPTSHLTRQVGPFSDLAIGFKVGVAGIGVELTTPIAQRFNIRASGSFFSYQGSYNYSGTNITGDLKLRSAGASLDWYPFNNSFRISPGVTVYNGNSLNASAMVPGGQSFDLGDQTFTSSTTDPIHGSAAFLFGNKTAPSLTFGFGNVIPRRGTGHFTIPVELGFQYISTPKITLALTGTACTNGFCQSTASNQEFQASLQQENVDLNNDISPLRFYPIASIGMAYRF